jgi:hypothetical protein
LAVYSSPAILLWQQTTIEFVFGRRSRSLESVAYLSRVCDVGWCGLLILFCMSWFLLNDDVVSIFCICTVDEAAVDEMKAHLLDWRCKYRSFQTKIDARTKQNEWAFVWNSTEFIANFTGF